ncbi:hypothetical protein TRFO_12651 [Tritrichomonas foetus]|uniref:Uncharacterized protein n=1 Tax=Tritrichomonas foetus TaxID=1144522 RepID=A0A1J4L5B3_9EUKA|nr:hypothetical protein TRFO_12651 [Tritrichomonas foetus]|eukprot:OHT17125.1 hypothetical protein TRFO_12651 [Tritrichomonas foetus]
MNSSENALSHLSQLDYRIDCGALKITDQLSANLLKKQKMDLQDRFKVAVYPKKNTAVIKGGNEDIYCSIFNYIFDYNPQITPTQFREFLNIELNGSCEGHRRSSYNTGDRPMTSSSSCNSMPKKYRERSPVSLRPMRSSVIAPYMESSNASSTISSLDEDISPAQTEDDEQTVNENEFTPIIQLGNRRNRRGNTSSKLPNRIASMPSINESSYNIQNYSNNNNKYRNKYMNGNMKSNGNGNFNHSRPESPNCQTKSQFTSQNNSRNNLQITSIPSSSPSSYSPRRNNKNAIFNNTNNRKAPSRFQFNNTNKLSDIHQSASNNTLQYNTQFDNDSSDSVCTEPEISGNEINNNNVEQNRTNGGKSEKVIISGNVLTFVNNKLNINKAKSTIAGIIGLAPHLNFNKIIFK